MYSERVSRSGSAVCDKAQGDQAPSEPFQTPQQHATRSGHARRCRTKPSKWRGHVRNNHTLETGAGNRCLQTVTYHELSEADLENQLQVNKTLKRVQQAAHRDLLFAQDRIAKYQAGCMQLEAQNQYLQQAILTLTAQEMQGPNVAHASVGGHMDGEDEDADECSAESSADLVHVPFSEAS